jgi:hypothetical protein
LPGVARKCDLREGLDDFELDGKLVAFSERTILSQEVLDQGTQVIRPLPQRRNMN